jgi:hypothetical protein
MFCKIVDLWKSLVGFALLLGVWRSQIGVWRSLVVSRPRFRRVGFRFDSRPGIFGELFSDLHVLYCDEENREIVRHTVHFW